jgi:NAD(P)-dependent dehydrogenase (short-subunit alcohol dehydrogenase family)
MTSTLSLTGQTTTKEVVDAFPSSASGKIILITGVSHGGIGDATARGFAMAGASTVIVTGRQDERLSEIVSELSKDYPSTTFRPLKLDLNSLAVTRKAAEEILSDSSIPHIDILVNNAGGTTLSEAKQLTEDGFETILQQNYIGHFLFTTLLLPKIRAAAKKNPLGGTRVVAVASAALVTSPFRFSDWQFDGRPNSELPDDEKPMYAPLTALLGLQEQDGYHFLIAYGQAKTAVTLFAVQLNALLASEGIYSFAVNPGVVNSAAMARVTSQMSEEERAPLAKSRPLRSIEQGAAHPLRAALCPDLKPEDGVYLDAVQLPAAPAFCTDPTKAEKLWKLTEELVAGK